MDESDIDEEIIRKGEKGRKSVAWMRILTIEQPVNSFKTNV